MNQRTQELTAAWLEKAGRDLEAEDRLIAGENPLADVGVFQPSPERSSLALALAKEIYIFCEAAIRKGAK